MGNQAIDYFEANRDAFVSELIELGRIPSVSFPGFPPGEVERSARAAADILRRSGLEGVEILTVSGAHPYVYGEWLQAVDMPTVLLYAHHDVQPPGREDKWETPPFSPTRREDGRLYGRGIVDDKAGFMVHAAAIRSYLKTAGRLPVNVKIIVEGEEETGSAHLEEFLHKYRDKMRADVIVLTDTANFDVGIPAITYMLRGIVAVNVEVRGLKHPLHSGMWGGAVPDPVMALAKILSRLVDDRGCIAIPGVSKDVRRLTAREKKRLAALPFREREFRRQAGLLPSIRLAGERGRSVWERLWTRPSLTIHAFEASSMKGAINQIVDSAQARLSIRTVPNQDPRRVLALLKKALTENPPWGMEVRILSEDAAPWWVTEPEGPAFAMAERALARGYGKEPVHIGCGGTIPFVKPFSKVLGGAPALLIGVEDPYCNAHAENESLDLNDLYKGVRSAIHLYEELAALGREEGRRASG